MAELDEDGNYSEIDNYEFLEKSFTCKLYSPTPVKKTVKAARCPKGTKKIQKQEIVKRNNAFTIKNKYTLIQYTCQKV
jgi:hypothetical protein